MYDIRPFIEGVKQNLSRHYLGEPGKYSQWVNPPAGQPDSVSHERMATPYGCAIAVNILYTINEMPSDMEERIQIIRVLQGFQNKETGLFESSGNYATHTTATLAGALNLFDARPLYQAVGFKDTLSKEGLTSFMEQIDWEKDPWRGAHLGSGIYGSMLLTGMADDEWQDNYFDWLDSNADSETGLWRKGCLEGAPWFHYLASTFHYVFNYEYAKRAVPYPKQLLDTCIRAYRDGNCMDFSKELGWADIDFAYLLARVQKRAGSRMEETQEILEQIEDGLVKQLLALDVSDCEVFNNTNTLFAIVSALAVLQDALPGTLKTTKPLQLVLDRRPFI